MKNKTITTIQVALVILWGVVTWGVDPVAWNIPTGLPNIDQIWALLVAVVTIVPAFYIQKYKDKK